MAKYSRKYLQTYIWKGIEMILRFASMFVVVPLLTSDPTIYGIYVICASVNIFLSYADFGFMGSGMKYAAEYFAKGDRKKEIEVIGFTGFILLIFTVLLSLIFLYLSFKPEILLKDVGSENGIEIASKLLLILAIFSPLGVLSRLLSVIYSIRIEEYILRLISVLPSVLSIISVYWFFREGHYDIVGYSLFGQLIGFIAALVTLFVAKLRYKYDLFFLFRSITFNKEIFKRSYQLALSGLFATVSWILYYEIDSISIGKLIGVKEVAFFGIGLTFLNFFRNIFGVFFSPFLIRFNHFIGNDDEEGLKSFFIQIVRLSVPIVVLPIVCLFLLAEPLILSWVGTDYISSIRVAQMVVLLNVFAFIHYPGGNLLYTKERFKEIYIMSIINPIVFWLGVILTYKTWGIESFAFFKFFTFALAAFIYTHYSLKLLNISFIKLFKDAIVPIIVPLLVLILLILLGRDYLPREKGKINLLIVCSYAGVSLLISGAVAVFSTQKNRLLFKEILLSLKK